MAGDERMGDPDPGIEAHLFRRLDRRFAGSQMSGLGGANRLDLNIYHFFCFA